MSTFGLSTAVQRSAAYWNTCMRCSPRVVPVLPPIGVAAVVSLKPTPGRLPLTTMIFPCAKACGAAAQTVNAARASAVLKERMLLLLQLGFSSLLRCQGFHLLGRQRGMLGRVRSLHGLVAGLAGDVVAAVLVRRGHHHAHEA